MTPDDGSNHIDKSKDMIDELVPGDLEELEGRQSFINWALTMSTTWTQEIQPPMRKL